MVAKELFRRWENAAAVDTIAAIRQPGRVVATPQPVAVDDALFHHVWMTC